MEEKLTASDEEWRSMLLESADQLASALRGVQRVAVIGIKPMEIGGPAFYVPEFLQQSGYDVVPIPVYYPEVTEILGQPVHRSLSTVVPGVDMVVLFRRSTDVPLHLDEMLAAKPRLVWMQLGIAHEAVAHQLAAAGIAVVQNRCVKVELQRRSM